MGSSVLQSLTTNFLRASLDVSSFCSIFLTFHAFRSIRPSWINWSEKSVKIYLGWKSVMKWSRSQNILITQFFTFNRRRRMVRNKKSKCTKMFPYKMELLFRESIPTSKDIFWNFILRNVWTMKNFSISMNNFSYRNVIRNRLFDLQ